MIRPSEDPRKDAYYYFGEGFYKFIKKRKCYCGEKTLKVVKRGCLVPVQSNPSLAVAIERDRWFCGSCGINNIQVGRLYE